MIIKKTPISVSKYLNSETKKLKKKIAFIPTMGALHDGHLSLVKKAKKKGYFTIVSIYVNPSQFAPNEDFSKYPRSLKSDLKVCSDIDIVPGNFMLNSAGVKPIEGARYIFAFSATSDAIVSEQIVSVPIKPIGPCCSVEPVAIIIP